MKYELNKLYGKWVYKGLIAIPKTHRIRCQHCDKPRTKLLRFERLRNDGSMIDWTELGSECVKHFNFNIIDAYQDLAP